MIATALTEMFGLQHPIILGPMGGVSGGHLAATVSNAGGLGLVGGGYGDPAWLRTELSRMKEATRRPWGVGLITWSANPSVVELVLGYRPHAVMLSFGDSRPYVSAIKAAGCKLICQVQGLEEARLAQEAGADLIVAEGTEAGGHGGGRATLPLVPAVVDAVKPTPVLAAGGIADGRGLAAALMLGAQGALIGTRFLATPEARGRGHSKDAILNALGSQTAASKFFDDVLGLRWPGALVRSIRNPLLDRWAQRQQDWALAAEQIRPSLEAALAAGDFVIAGESAGLIHDIVPAGELVARIAREAEALLG